MSDNDNLPPINVGDIQLHPDFGDVESMLNMRNWLEEAIKAKGAKVTDAGMGMGAADLGFILEGHRFSLVIRPRISPPTPATEE